MKAFPAIVRSGFAAVLLHPLRSGAAVAAVTAVLVPFTAGLAISEGLLDRASEAARAGADLVVTGVRFGRPAPLPHTLLIQPRSGVICTIRAFVCA